MNRLDLYKLVVNKLKDKTPVDIIKTDVRSILQYSTVKDLLELKHSGKLYSQPDAIIRVVANKLYSERA